MKKISVVVSAFNEENKIGDCLESVKWADEIIVLNNSSSDNTLEIAKKYTSKIFNRENYRMLNINKNYGFSKADSEWILCLDSDERVSKELAQEIKDLLNQDPKEDAFWIPRKNIIFGKWIQHTGWYPDHQLRLFKKGKGKFPEKHVHEMLEVNGEIAYLNNHLIHYNYENLSQFFYKMINIYVPNEADNLVNKNYVFNYLDSMRFPFQEFISRFFAREGYKDGLHGLVLSLLMAFYHFTIFVSLWEREGFKEVQNKEILWDVEKELKKEHKETMFWFFTEKIKIVKNPFNRFWLRFRKNFL